MIIIDDREKYVLENIHDCNVKIFRIKIGDFLIVEEKKVLFCIERKTVADFKASFKDGRYKSERDRMKLLRDKNHCRLIWIIEGRKRYSKSINSAIMKLSLRDDIHCIMSKSIKQTCKFLEYVNREFTDQKMYNTIFITNDVMECNEKFCSINLELENAWSILPGISSITARKIIKQTNIIDVLKKNKIIKLDKRAMKSMNDIKKYLKDMLLTIRRVTDNNVDIINDYILTYIKRNDSKDILSTSISDLLAKNKKRIGPKLGEKISDIMYFTEK